ncbi:MAG: hypothetical protein ACKPA7_04225, partial [Sphaerospermopsis kisseleviana]
PEIATPEYWIDHVEGPLHFAQVIQSLNQLGYKLFLEIGPKPILLEMDRQCLPKNVGLCLSSLNPPQEDWQQMLSTLGEVYMKGVKVDWSAFDQDYPRSKVALPTYPFQRQRYPLETSRNGHKKGVLENNLNQIDELLSQIDTDKLVQELNLSEKLTEQELQLLPKLLKILTTRTQKYGQSSEQNSNILQQLEKTPEGERQQLMLHYLQGVVGQLLGFENFQNPDPQLGFFDMGMKYPMMLELKNLLEK